MGDKLVDDIARSLGTLARANGLSADAIRPYVDALVNRLRDRGLGDDVIRDMLKD